MNFDRRVLDFDRIKQKVEILWIIKFFLVEKFNFDQQLLDQFKKLVEKILLNDFQFLVMLKKKLSMVFEVHASSRIFATLRGCTEPQVMPRIEG